MDTIRQKIVDAVVDQLKLIRTSNSYQYYAITGNYVSNIGERVYKWRSVPATPGSELDYLVVRDIDELVKEPSPEAKRVEKQLHMLVEIVTSGRTADEDLRNKYYADVEIAIGQGAMNRWGVNTGATRPKLNRSLLEQESMVLAGGIVEFYIDYPQYAWYPYAV